MPSGAKKRKAAKKKLQKNVHDSANIKGSQSNSQAMVGSDTPNSYDERDNDGGVIEREGNVEGGGVDAHDKEGSKEVSLGKGNVVEDDVAREFRNGNKRSSSSSSSGSGSSSSSDDDEIVVEKEKSSGPELGKVEPSVENSGVLEVVYEGVEESIPTEESVKQVVSMPLVSTVVSGTVPIDDLLTSDVIELGLRQNVDEVLQPFKKKLEVAPGVEKIEEKMIAVMDEGTENTSESVCVTVRDDVGLLPESSGIKAVEGCCADDDCKPSEIHKYLDEQPLLSSAPVPVRRTSWMDCCGLFDVFSGSSSR